MKDKNLTVIFEPLKFVGIITMILTHCFIFLYRLYPEYREVYNLSIINRFAFFNGFYSMTLPTLAGAFYYVKFKKYIRGHYLTNIDTNKFFKQIGYLFLTESIKNGLIFGWESFFRWDTLHFISTTILILTLVVNRLGIKFIYAILIISTFLVGLFSYKNLALIMLQNYENTIFQSYYLGLLFICFLYFIIFNKILNMNKYFVYFLTSILFLILLLNFHNKELNIIVSTFPISIFLQLGQNGGHIWPLFPWANCIFIGFLVAKYIDTVEQSKLRAGLFAILLHIPILYFIFYQLEDYQNLLSKRDFFTSTIFQPHWLLFYLLNIFFLVSVYSIVFPYKFFKFNFKFLSNLNQYILPIYFIHMAVAWKLLNPLSHLFHFHIIRWLYPLLVFFLTFCFMQFFLIVKDKNIWFRLRKIDKR